MGNKERLSKGEELIMYKEFDMRGVGKQSALAKVGFGATTEKYRWVQTMNFVDIFIPLPERVTKANQLVVKYTRDTLHVSVKGAKEPILDGKTWGPLRVDDCTWTIEDPDGVHEKFESDSEEDSSEDEGPKRKVLHMEMAKYDNDQITKNLKQGFFLGVLKDGPLIKEPKSLPPDYYDTWLNDRDAGRLWGDGAREENRK